jgi:plasmid stabilization system protein ParE
MARVISTPVSRTDVVEIVLRIRRANSKAARKLLDATNDTVTLLARFPDIGLRRPELVAATRYTMRSPRWPAPLCKLAKNHLPDELLGEPKADGVSEIRCIVFRVIAGIQMDADETSVYYKDLAQLNRTLGQLVKQGRFVVELLADEQCDARLGPIRVRVLIFPEMLSKEKNVPDGTAVMLE